MIWLTWEKMITCCYSKFRPVNRMHYIKCGVFTKRVIYYKFTFVWHCVKQGTTQRPTSHLSQLYTVPFLWSWEEHDSAVGLMISLASVCYGDFCWGLLLLLLFFFFLKIAFTIASLGTWFRVGVNNLNFTYGFLLKFYFFSGHCSRPTIVCLV